MKLGFEESQTPYNSASQRARNWTERWVEDWMFCPNCGATKLSRFPANTPLADFFCSSCHDQFEVKSKNANSFGQTVADGAYHAKIERLNSKTNPNLVLLGYNAADKAVHTVFVVPKHFFIPDIVQKRKPLAATARRAGWIGSNILIGKVPDAGRVYVLKNGVPTPKVDVLEKWQKTIFLRNSTVAARGWLVEVMKVIERIDSRDFTLESVYSFEHHLGSIYPENRNVRPKIRQQLQVLRDNGFLEFIGQGRYRKILTT